MRVCKAAQSGVEIRIAQPEDAAAVLEYCRLIGGETDYLTYGAEGLPVSEEQERAFLESRAGSSDGKMLLALENGRIVGVGDYVRVSAKPRLAHRAELGLSVRKDHWNRGIGRALALRCLAGAQAIGCTAVELQVLESNAAAIHLYKKLGFVIVGRHERFLRYANGQYAAAFFMNLTLA